MFTDALQIELALTIAGTTWMVPAGDVKVVDLDLSSSGFSGTVEFIVVDDKDHGGVHADRLFDHFSRPDLIEVSLGVRACFFDRESASSIDPVAVVGLVTRKGVYENADPDLGDHGIPWRRYRVDFADPARVLWSQHFPCELYTGKSVKDVIEAQAGDRIKVTFDWSGIDGAPPMVYLNLQPELGASFYDFVVWYVDTRAGVFAYDYAARGYRLSGAKEAAGTPVDLFHNEVERRAFVFPEAPRHAPRVLNSYTKDPARRPIAHEHAAAGIRQDHLMRTPSAQRVDDRVTLETSRLVVRSSELEVELRRWPASTLQPGALVKFNANDPRDAESAQLAQVWRVVHHRIRAVVRDERPGRGHLDAATCDVELRVELEQRDERWVRLPSYRPPVYPGYVEGKVVSELGEDAELTYQFYTDEDTSQEQYKVEVPLWGDQIVTAPFEPQQGSGKMYLPIHKHARVLLALDFMEASIARLLDWGGSVRGAMDGQGERIFFGKTSTASTTVDHVYDDDKPVFSIVRTNDTDTAGVVIAEGELNIQVREQPDRTPGTLACTINLNKQKRKGIAVSIVNEDDAITQTLSMDGTSIILTVKRGDDAKDGSTITQTFDRVRVEAGTVAVRCATFDVDITGANAT